MIQRKIVAALLSMLISVPGVSGEIEIAPGRFAVTLRNINRQPADAAAAQRTLARLAEAALAVCGASDFSLHELQLAVRKSACWHNSMEDAVKQINNPRLTTAWQLHQHNNRRL